MFIQIILKNQFMQIFSQVQSFIIKTSKVDQPFNILNIKTTINGTIYITLHYIYELVQI
jgi:hypothetical protein